MFSFLDLKQTPLLVATNLLLLLLNYLVTRSAIHSPYRVPRPQRRLSYLIIILFCLFSFWGSDWFHYAEKYSLMVEDYQTTIESVYYFIAQNLSPNYLVFRMVIWGGGLILLYFTVKRLDINIDLFLLVFGCIWVIYFSYARVSLAMAVLFFGSSFLIKPIGKNYIFSYIIGVALIALSIYFHKSALWGVAIVTLSAFTNRLGKKASILFVLLFPLLVYFVRGFLIDFMASGFDAEEGLIESYASSGQTYLDRSSGERGLGSTLQRLLEVVPLYLLALFTLGRSLNTGIDAASKESRFYSRILFYCVLLSSVFLFDLGMNTRVVYIRFIRFSIIPASIVLSCLLSKQGSSRYPRFLFYLSFCGSLYAVLYMAYCAL